MEPEEVVKSPEGAETEVIEEKEDIANVKEEVSTEKVAEVKETPAEQAAKKKTAQERIDEITRKRREAEREAEYWKNKALEKKEPEKPKPQIPESRPKVADFETVEQYEDALLTWHEHKKAKENTLAEQNRKKEEAVKQFNSKADALRAVHDDYDEVINAPIFTDAMKQVLLSSENGPGIAYYLGQNRDIANKIAQLPPELQPYELGKLETQYLVAQKTKKTTSAPEPINPVGSTTGGSSIDESKLSDDEWYKREQKRRLERLQKAKG